MTGMSQAHRRHAGLPPLARNPEAPHERQRSLFFSACLRYMKGETPAEIERYKALAQERAQGLTRLEMIKLMARARKIVDADLLRERLTAPVLEAMGRAR